MSEQQLHLFNGIGLVVLVVVAILTRATLRRIAGAAAGPGTLWVPPPSRCRPPGPSRQHF